MRRNPMVRVRRYDQRPQSLYSWAEEREDGLWFCDASNPYFARDKRMQSWRRPL